MSQRRFLGAGPPGTQEGLKAGEGPGQRAWRKTGKEGTTHLPPTRAPASSLHPSCLLLQTLSLYPVSVSQAPPSCLSTISLTLRSLSKPQALLESLPPLPSFLTVLGSPKSQTKFYLGLSLPPSPSISARLYLLKPVPSRAPPGVPACPRASPLSPAASICQDFGAANPLAWRPRAWAIRGEGSRKRRGGTRASAPRETR